MVNARERDVAETLGGASLPVGGQTDRLDITVGRKQLVHRVLVCREGQVADEKGVGRLGLLVAESVCPSVVLLLVRVVPARGNVDLDGTPVDFLSVDLVHGLLGSFGGGKVDETESLGSVVLVVPLDTSVGHFANTLEFGLEPVVVDVPRELTDKDGAGRAGGGGGGGLGGLDGRLGLFFGLALTC